MKLHASTNVIEKSGNFEESKFSIEASSKAFFILSDGLYSNKILAVVRELSTNAYDSHVEAGKVSVPFDVHLPTQLEPTFFIRDYGTSMDHDSCMQLYTTYFRSTRNNSNDAVGCLGLGSKAPFAYSDSFTVEAYLDGKRRLYTAYKNEDGSPVFSLMDTFKTSEPNGIKVSISVQDSDVSRFIREAHKVYEFFKVRPKFIGESISYTSPDKVIEGNNWYFDDNSSDNLIIMGQIAYPLDHYQLMNTDLDKKTVNFIENSSGLRLFVKIGDVDITPSRESLSYSKETKANIVNMARIVAEEIAVKIQEEIKNQPSLFRARKKYVQVSDQCHSIKTAVESLHKSLTWNDTKLFDSNAAESVTIKGCSVDIFEKSQWRKKIEVKKNTEHMFFGTNTKFIIDDLNRGGVSRIRQMMRDAHDSRCCYCYKLSDGETVESCKLYDIMGGATKEDVIFTSSLPKVEYNRQSYGNSDGLPAVQIQVYNEETGKFEICNMSVKFENAHYFIESKDSVQIGHSYIDISYVTNALSFIHQHYRETIGDATFYVVKPSVVKNRKLEQRDNWTNGCRLLENIFADAVEKHHDDIIEVNTRNSLSIARNYRWFEVLEMTKTDSKAKQIMMEYNEYKQRVDNISADMYTIEYMAQRLPNVQSINFSNVKINTEKFSKDFDNEMKKYPMLKFAGNVWDKSDKQLVADYIDGINNTL
jgi:hypothetical protein